MVEKGNRPRTLDPVKKKSRFLTKARKVHGDKYEYPDDYVNCKEAIRIVCPTHGAFLQTPDSHIQGAGCSWCRSNKGGITYTTQEMVERFRGVHGNLYDYSGVKYKNSQEKVEIGCRLHGVFHQAPTSHLQGSGCPKCAGKQVTEDDFILQFESKGFTNIKYIGGFVSTVKRCEFLCIKHGKFSSKPTNILNKKHGCRLCANEAIGKSLSLGLSEIVKGIEDLGIFEVINVEKHNDLSYTTDSKVTVKCIEHGVVETRTYPNLIKTLGCAKCLYDYKSNSRLYSTETFVGLAKKVHGDLYDYSKVAYENSTTNVDVICKIHGSFSLSPRRHLNGQKCPECRVKSSWSRDGFINFVNTNYEGLATVYFLRCYNDSENFVKVGHTCRTINTRFGTKKLMPYDYEVLFQLKTDASIVYDVEKGVMEAFNTDRYLPKIEFGGKTECFAVEKSSAILDFIKEKTCLNQSN